METKKKQKIEEQTARNHFVRTEMEILLRTFGIIHRHIIRGETFLPFPTVSLLTLYVKI